MGIKYYRRIDADDPELILRQTRERFIEAFPGRCASFAVLGDAIAQLGADGPIDSLRRLTHQMAGLAGTIGFPAVSQASAHLEQLVVAAAAQGLDRAALTAGIEGLKDAFTADVASPPGWARPVQAETPGELVMLVEDDEAQRALVTSTLRAAGYRVVAVADGSAAFDVARAERPALILLDVDLPGTDGYTACRRIKSSPDLSSTPVAFMTARDDADDRVNGLALGADDYLTKPVDIRELTLRLKTLLRRRRPETPPPSGILDFETFSQAAAELIGRDGGSLAIIRLPNGGADAALSRLNEELRRRDLIGRYDDGHVVVFLPGTQATVACDRFRVLGAALQREGAAIAAGVAGVVAGAGTRLESLLAAADDGLNEARYRGEFASLKTDKRTGTGGAARPTVLLADDDPDVMRIVDAQMRAAGYDTLVVFDGAAAAAVAAEKQPDLIVLDLMMPRQTGFDVLRTLPERPARRPRTIVLSGRGREADVTRAFELGADDYMTKPFSPQELLARAARLLR